MSFVRTRLLRQAEQVVFVQVAQYGYMLRHVMHELEVVFRYAELLQVQEVADASTKVEIQPVHVVALEQVEQ